MPPFRAPKGTYDLLPPHGDAVLAVRDGLAAPLRRAGYAYVETPLFEDTALFVRGVGESTDVVTKEMYSFLTRGGDAVTLRPEGTAGVVRAVVEHRLDTVGLPVKLWYSGSYFRYERPQKGRFRHFSQVGAEILGSEDPAGDAELIVLAVDAYRALGLTGVRVLLNSLGSSQCRSAYRQALQDFLGTLDLDEATGLRAQVNPLRVLDDKRPEIRAALVDAPLVTDYLTDADRRHHDEVRAMLTACDVAFDDDPRLVRGLDYYSRTLVEFQHAGLGAQSAVGGGGRYDTLAETLGGPALPGVGFALGVDRTVLALQAEGLLAESAPAAAGSVEVFAVPLGEQARRRLFEVTVQLRRDGVRADIALGGRGVKGAMRAADRSGARFALIAGDRDLGASAVQVKDMASGDQVSVPLDEVVRTLKEQLS